MRYNIQDDEMEEVNKLKDKYLEVKRNRGKIHFHFPHKLRFPVYWTLFFGIAGIVQQSIIAKTFVLKDFFARNYISWFDSFGNFVSVYQMSGWKEIGLNMAANWYYFLFTGGIIASILTIIRLVTSIKIRKKDDFTPGSL